MREAYFVLLYATRITTSTRFPSKIITQMGSALIGADFSLSV